jgi:hypothetical protein
VRRVTFGQIRETLPRASFGSLPSLTRVHVRSISPANKARLELNLSIGEHPGKDGGRRAGKVACCMGPSALPYKARSAQTEGKVIPTEKAFPQMTV